MKTELTNYAWTQGVISSTCYVTLSHCEMYAGYHAGQVFLTLDWYCHNQGKENMHLLNG